MYIERHIKKTIDRMLHSFPSVLLTGPRQVGKSTLLRNGYAETRYLSMDDRVVLNAVKEDPRGFFELQGTPLILDEIQRVPEAFIDLEYEITKLDLSNTSTVATITDLNNGVYTYTSVANPVNISVEYEDYLAVAADYTLTYYSDGTYNTVIDTPVEAGTYWYAILVDTDSIKIKGNGHYTISPRDINDIQVSVAEPEVIAALKHLFIRKVPLSNGAGRDNLFLGNEEVCYLDCWELRYWAGGGP